MKHLTHTVRASSWLFITASLLLILGLQLVQFTAGYRVTADDAMFMQYLQHGWADVWAVASKFAYLTGRIGHFFMTPLNALGAYWAGHWGLRLFMVAGYFAVLLLFSVYSSHLLANGSRWATAFMLLGMLSLHPLAYDHMPPTAYPLQNTLPFLMLVSIRLVLLRYPSPSMLLLLLLYLLQGGALLVSEYALVLGSAMMATEHLARALDHTTWKTPHRLFKIPVDARRLTADALLAVITLVIYIAFRVAHPSQYEGNTPDGLDDPLRFFLTAFYHVLAGTSVYRISLDTQPATLLLALLVAAITFMASRTVLPRLTLPSRRYALSGLVISALFMLYMTFPLAATSRAQRWCLEEANCGFLDSRSSFLAIGALLYCLLGVFKLSATPRRILGVSLLLAFIAALNVSQNQRVARSMALGAEPWQNARVLACSLPPAAPVTSAQMASIDPHSLVPLHSYEVAQNFWLEHMNYLRASGRCGVELTSTSAALIYPFIYIYGRSSFVTLEEPLTDHLHLLQEGWSLPETWGIWSNGSESILQLDLSEPFFSDVTSLIFDVRLYWGPSVNQHHIKVDVNGQPRTDWIIPTAPLDPCCRFAVDISDVIGQSDVKIRLRYQYFRDPAHPQEGADRRSLALGLHRLELLEGNQP